MLVTWMNKNNILSFAIPNGGKRHAFEAYKFKRCGVQSGVPDLFIPVARKGYHGLFIEMKRQKGGVVSDQQLFWLTNLRRQGYIAEVARGADAAIKIIENYLFGGSVNDTRVKETVQEVVNA